MVNVSQGCWGVFLCIFIYICINRREKKVSIECVRMFHARVHILQSKTRNGKIGGIWMAQMIGLLTLDFSSGHDLSVLRLSPLWGSMLSVDPA